MKTLADVKRALVKGSKWEAIHLGWKDGDKPTPLGIREVSIVQSNGVAFKTEHGTDSWLYYPPASEVRVHESGFTILVEGTDRPLLSYKMVA